MRKTHSFVWLNCNFFKGREADYDIEDGKSNFLEGAMLIGMYAVIALAFVSIPKYFSGILLISSFSLYIRTKRLP